MLLVIIAVLSLVLQIVLAVVVLLKNTTSLKGAAFCALSLALAAWATLTFAFDVFPQVAQSITVVRWTMFFVVLQNALFVLFTYSLNRNSVHFSWKLAAYLVLTALVAVLFVSTPLMFSHLAYNQSGSPYPEAQPGMLLFAIHAALSIAVGFRFLIRKFRVSHYQERAQLTYILLGSIVLWGVVPITNFVLSITLKTGFFVTFSPLYAFAFSSLIAYAIVRHHLFDIRFAVVRTLAYGCTLVTLAAVYYVVAYVLSRVLFSGHSVLAISNNPQSIALALALAFLFQPVKRFFDKVTNTVFYRNDYKSEDFFTRLSEVLTSTVDMHGLLVRAAHEIATMLKADQAFFYLYRANDSAHHTTAGTPHHSAMPVQDARLLDEYVTQNGNAIFLTELLDDRYQPVQRMLRSHGIALVMPLRQAEVTIGYLLLGDHLSGNYTRRDLGVLTTVANELVIAIQNALSLHQVKELNATLQQRIDVATKALRSSNAQLKHLDEVKDEFMSMASHQLRTPLTSIKGYLSMVIDGDAGKITPQQEKLLQEAFHSSERMVHLIADFLNVSRLQTGKFVVEKAEIDLNELVSVEVRDLQVMAAGRNMTLRLEAPDEPLYARADAGKLREVIMNFVDNAIYYSKAESTITVKVAGDDDSISFTVVDQGIGVPKDEQTRLFGKFFRATNARKQRPDGTGVGLYLARKVIAAHHGSIIFASQEGKGSTFGFRLPRSKAVKQHP